LAKLVTVWTFLDTGGLESAEAAQRLLCFVVEGDGYDS